MTETTPRNPERSRMFNRLALMPADSLINLGDGRALYVETWRPRGDELAERGMLPVVVTGAIVLSDDHQPGDDEPNGPSVLKAWGFKRSSVEGRYELTIGVGCHVIIDRDYCVYLSRANAGLLTLPGMYETVGKLRQLLTLFGADPREQEPEQDDWFKGTKTDG